MRKSGEAWAAMTAAHAVPVPPAAVTAVVHVAATDGLHLPAANHGAPQVVPETAEAEVLLPAHAAVDKSNVLAKTGSFRNLPACFRYCVTALFLTGGC